MTKYWRLQDIRSTHLTVVWYLSSLFHPTRCTSVRSVSMSGSSLSVQLTTSKREYNSFKKKGGKAVFDLWVLTIAVLRNLLFPFPVIICSRMPIHASNLSHCFMGCHTICCCCRNCCRCCCQNGCCDSCCSSTCRCCCCCYLSLVSHTEHCQVRFSQIIVGKESKGSISHQRSFLSGWPDSTWPLSSTTWEDIFAIRFYVIPTNCKKRLNK